MPKFKATSIADLMVPAANAGRVVRKASYALSETPFTHVVIGEASDGSFFELDGQDFDHAKALACNAVDWLSCRSCSVWTYEADGSLTQGPSLFIVTESYNND